MGQCISAAIDIAVGPEEVWAALVEFGAYGEWNPYIVVAEGSPRPGERLSLRMSVAGKTFAVRPTVIEVSRGRTLRWRGRLGLPGIFDADHLHRLEATAEGTRYTQREHFTGALVPFLGRTVEATEAAFVAMNTALKERVEGAGVGSPRRPSGDHGV